MVSDELRRLQWKKLSAGLRALVSNPFWQKRLSDAGLRLEELRSLDDLPRLPFVTKEDLLRDQAEHPPYGTNRTQPLERYVRLHQTSGTSGRRLRWLDTVESWEWILDCWDVIYESVGATSNDRFFFPFSFGPFLGFWAGFEAARRAGRFVLAGGGMTTSARLDLLLEHSVTFVLATPTYALRMAEVAEQEGVNLSQSKVRGLILAGEPGACLPSLRERLEKVWNARVFDHSGMTEIGSLGIEFEDRPRELVLLEEHCIAEFVEPGGDQPIPEGQVGELVLTNLGRWDCPLLRYRTGDLVRWRRSHSPNERPWARLEGGILGRVDDMLWIKGNNIYPSAIEAVVREFEEVAEFAIRAAESSEGLVVRVAIEPFPQFADDRSLTDRIAKAFQDRFYFRPALEIVTPGSLPRFEMKARRFTREP